MMYDNCFVCLSDLQVIIEEYGHIFGPLCRSFADAASSSSHDEQQFTSTSVDSSLCGWLLAGHHISLKNLHHHKQLLIIVRLCQHS
jgi:hypothetical protein